MKKSTKKETLQKAARSEFSSAISQIASERKIDPESIYEAIRAALVTAYRHQVEDFDVEAYYFSEIDSVTGSIRIFKSPATAWDEETGAITAWDDSDVTDVTPAGFGRIAAQTAKQVIIQKIRESEKDQIITEYSDKLGTMVTGQVLRMEGRDVLFDIGRGHGIMPPQEQMRGEFYRNNARMAVLIKEIADGKRGKQVIVSRADKELVAKLFDREVPEIATGTVIIKYLAREAGVRTKVVVKAEAEGIDPVGSCVGQRGVRVQEIIKELNNEKIDIIPYHEDMVELIKATLAPAENMQVEYNSETHHADVTLPDDQVSLAIGRGGQNVRLAAKVLGISINIKSLSGEIKSETKGTEEYEIDSYADLEPETREALVQNKLTTMNDLMRFKVKIANLDGVTDDQKQMLLDKIALEEQKFAEQNAEKGKTE